MRHKTKKEMKRRNEKRRAKEKRTKQEGRRIKERKCKLRIKWAEQTYEKEKKEEKYKT